ncbi:MAG: hypothetical protein IT384_16805 [Deltaproteobacteria bacterium]|nr:hypothetical protein [Deltaproteobacteria bacterium]
MTTRYAKYCLLFLAACGEALLDPTFRRDPILLTVSPDRGPSEGVDVIIEGEALCPSAELFLDDVPVSAVEHRTEQILRARLPAHPIGESKVRLSCGGVAVPGELSFHYYATHLRFGVRQEGPDGYPDRLVDLDGNALDDLLVFTDRGIEAYRNPGGSFEQAPAFAVPGIDDGSPYGPCPPDPLAPIRTGPDAETVLPLRYPCQSGEFLAFVSVDDGHELGRIPLEPGESTRIVDLDGDEQMDLLLWDGAGVRMLRGLSGLQFGGEIELYQGLVGELVEDPRIGAFRAIDLNEDGVQDSVLRVAERKWIAILGSRDGTPTVRSFEIEGGGLFFFDEDRVLDRFRFSVDGSGSRETLAIWRGVGPGTFDESPLSFDFPCPGRCVDRAEREDSLTAWRAPGAPTGVHHFLRAGHYGGVVDLLTLAAPTSGRTERLSEFSEVARLGRIDAEGWDDLLLWSRAPEIDPQLERGRPHIVFPNVLPSGALVGTELSPVASGGEQASIGDFNGDARADVLVITGSRDGPQNAHAALAVGGGPFREAEPIVLDQQGRGFGTGGAPVVARFDRDARDDFFLDGVLYKGQDSGAFSAETLFEWAHNFSGWSLAKDLDHDGVSELITDQVDGDDFVVFEHLDRTPPHVPVVVERGELLVAAVGDLNGDGVIDAVASDSFSRPDALVTIHLGQRGPLRIELGAAQTLATDQGPARGTPRVNDLDGDGDDDLVVWDGGGTLSIFENQGGMLRFVSRLSDAPSPFVTPCHLDAKDRLGLLFGEWSVTGDRGLTLSMAAASGAGLAYDRTSTLYLGPGPFAPIAYRAIGCADFDTDGLSDILVSSPTTGQLYIVRNESR